MQWYTFFLLHSSLYRLSVLGRATRCHGALWISA